MSNKQWFASWFDTPYYHILYQHRDDVEAQHFLDQLIQYLQPAKNARLLDLACGKGRHSIYLAQKGFMVTGVDLSPQSIQLAKQSASNIGNVHNAVSSAFPRPTLKGKPARMTQHYDKPLSNLSFDVHDMRDLYKANYFDVIINAFTSFGYFDNDEDHLRTLQNITKGLRKNGRFVMDFMNVEKVIANMKAREQKTVGGIRFHLSRKVKDGYIVKRIRFTDKGQQFVFEERVRAFTKADLQKLFRLAGLEVVATFGDYDLKGFKAGTSDRLILVGRVGE